MLLGEDVLFDEVLDDEGLLFSLGGVDPEQRVHFVDVAVHGLLVVEGAQVHLELAVPHELLRELELRLQVFHKQTRRNHQLAVLNQRVHHQFLQHLRQLGLEIFLLHLFYLVEGDLPLLALVLVLGFVGPGGA